jgi:hypothetical protein
MRELAGLLDRSSHTIRCWENDGMLPKSLIPKRDERTKWRYWTEYQVAKLQEWMLKNGMAPGKGLSGFQPDGERVQGMLEQLRQPRDLEVVKCPKCTKEVRNLAAHMRLAHPPRSRKK